MKLGNNRTRWWIAIYCLYVLNINYCLIIKPWSDVFSGHLVYTWACAENHSFISSFEFLKKILLLFSFTSYSNAKEWWMNVICFFFILQAKQANLSAFIWHNESWRKRVLQQLINNENVEGICNKNTLIVARNEVRNDTSFTDILYKYV